MPFQASVFLQQGFGVPGDFYANTPVRAQSYIINSASAANNVFGRAFSITSQGNANAGNTGSQVYAGILANPKQNASFGGSAGPLSPTLTLSNYSQADIVSEGSLVVTLPAAAAIGDVVIFANATGILSTVAPGVSLPAGSSNAFAFVDYFTVSGAGLAVITLTPKAPVASVLETIVSEGTITWSGSGASLATTIAGLLTTDKVLVSIQTAPTQAATIVSARVTAANTLTIVLSAANTSNDAIISYRIVR